MWSSAAKCWVAVCSICATFPKSDCNTKLLLLSRLSKLTKNSAWHIWKPGERFASRLRCYRRIWQSSPNPVLQQKSLLDPQRHVDFSWSELWNNAGWRREKQGLFLSFLRNNADLLSHLCLRPFSPAPILCLVSAGPHMVQAETTLWAAFVTLHRVSIFSHLCLGNRLYQPCS